MSISHRLLACAVFTVAFIASTCTPRGNSYFVTSRDVIAIDTTTTQKAARYNLCNDQMNYVPDPDYPEHSPIEYIRVNIHFMDSGPGQANFHESFGRQFALSVIDQCNERLANNVKMFLPIGNNTAVLPIPYRLKLTPMPNDPDDDGIYFHYDPDLYYYIHGRNTNRSSRNVIEKYSIQPDSVINVFLMPHPLDSIGRPGYKAVGTGIALGGAVKIAQIFSQNPPPESCVGLLNHEVGHIIGLSHTWTGRDGCDDTPKHPNCFTYTDTPPCDTEVSNNMMDYNQWQHALTPCQIGKAMRNIYSTNRRIRHYVERQWCARDPDATIVIRDSIVWNSAKFLRGDLLVEKGGFLNVRCRLSMPAGSRIEVAPGGTLLLDDGAVVENDCGQDWQGIAVRETGRGKGQIICNGTVTVKHAATWDDPATSGR